MGFLDDLFSPITIIYDAAVKPVLEATGLDDVVEDIADGIEDIAEDIAEGLEDLGEAVVDTIEEIGEELEEGFSKDGWMTKFVEEYLPAGGLVTAIVHASAGNEDYAKAAALKGTITMVEAAAAIGGTIALGPAGGVLGAGLGNGVGQILEMTLRETLPPTVLHLFPPQDLESALLGMATSMGGAALGAGAGKLAGKVGGAASTAIKNVGKTAEEIAENAAKQAAKEAVEKTTRQLVETALLKRYLLSTTKPLQEELLDEAGLPVSERRGTPPPEQLEQLELLEQKLIVQAIATKRHEQLLEGANEEQLQRFDRQIFAATTSLEQMETGGVDEGQFYAYQHDTLGTYYMRNGVVVWEVDDLAEATKGIELDKLGITEEERQLQIENWIQVKNTEGNSPSEWTLQRDPVLGDYMIKGDEVVWGVRTVEEARAQHRVDEARERGFASVDEYKAELVNSWRIAHQYAVEAGNATGEWQTGGQTDIVGDYMIKDGQIVWGARNPDEAEAMLPNQLAREKGFDDAEALREELERSWRISHQYDEEAGRDTGEWQTGGQSAVVGPYMIKNGVIAWGATTVEEAERILSERIGNEYDLVPADDGDPAAEDGTADEIPTDFDSFDPDNVETPVLIVTEADDGTPLDIQQAEREATTTPPSIGEDETIAELRAEIEALRRQVQELQEDVAETTPPTHDHDEMDEMGADDDMSGFDDPPPMPNEEDNAEEESQAEDELEMKPAVMPNDPEPADETEMKPAVMPSDPLDWNQQHGHPAGDAESAHPDTELQPVGATTEPPVEHAVEDDTTSFDMHGATPTLPEEVPVEGEPWSGTVEDLNFATEPEERGC